MRILYVGDVVGRSGRAVLLEQLPGLRASLQLDAVLVNGENAAAGYGLTATIAEEFFAAGTDLITMGNHVWDQRELIAHIDREPRIVRPLNLAPGAPGRGIGELRT
ncbi:MAG: YmdB family metallophosphoesterase, partial [Geminicoccaceae bacterium]